MTHLLKFSGGIKGSVFFQGRLLQLTLSARRLQVALLTQVAVFKGKQTREGRGLTCCESECSLLEVQVPRQSDWQNLAGRR